MKNYISKSLLMGTCITSLLGFELIGCSNFPTHTASISSTEDAANVYVSAYPEVPWSDISSKLAPKNNLTMDQAHSLAAVTTQAQVSQVASILAAGLGVGLSTTTQNLTTAVETGKTTGTIQNNSGVIPSSSGIPTTTLPSLSPDLTKGLPSYQVDGDTYIKESTALYQQAQILDNQFSLGYFPEGYSVHLITLQVNVQPKQRDVSYDVYMDVSLWPSNWSDVTTSFSDVNNSLGAIPSVVIYPLIISDAMELTSVGQSIQTIRQAALQLSGMLGNSGLNGGFLSGSNKLNSVIGLDKNSLVTVGRVNSNTIRMRLGAENSGSSPSGLSLVPRVYNVSLAVMTKFDDNHKQNFLQAVTHASYFSTDNNIELKSLRARPSLASKVRKTMNDFNYKLREVKNCDNKLIIMGTDWGQPDPQGDCIDSYLNLLRAADRQDLNFIFTHIKNAKDSEEGSKPTNGIVAALENNSGLNDSSTVLQQDFNFRRFLSKLVELQFDALYADFQIPLKAVKQPKLPAQGALAFLSDDPKSSASVVLQGGKGLDQSKLKAYLLVQKDCQSLPDSELNVAVKDGSELNINVRSDSSIAVKSSKPFVSGGTYQAKITKKCQTLNDAKIFSSSISIQNDTELDITFPSLKKNALIPTDCNPLTIVYGEEDLTNDNSQVNEQCKKDDKAKDGGQAQVIGKSLVQSYQVILTEATSTKESSDTSPISVSSKVILADGNGIGSLTFAANFDASKLSPILNVDGAYFLSVTNLTTPTSKETIGSKGFSPQPNQLYTLQLGGLMKGNPVTLKVTDTSPTVKDHKKDIANIPPLLVDYSRGIKEE